MHKNHMINFNFLLIFLGIFLEKIKTYKTVKFIVYKIKSMQSNILLHAFFIENNELLKLIH